MNSDQITFGQHYELLQSMFGLSGFYFSKGIKLKLIGMSVDPFNMLSVYTFAIPDSDITDDLEFYENEVSKFIGAWSEMPKQIIACECGTKSAAGQHHSHWCPLFFQE